MTDETRPEGQPPEAPPASDAPAGDAATAVAAPSEGPPAGEEEPKEKKLHQKVEMRDTGPCKKHIKVTVERADIDERMGDHFTKLLKDTNVPGFRPGKTPRRLIERRFRTDVADQVKTEVLMASLDQLGKDHDVAPLAPPDLDLDAIEIPKDGPLVYEFEVEVRPQFDLPAYKGLKLKRPVKTFTADDVTDARRLLLKDHSQVVPKDGPAEMGDIVVAEVKTRDGDRAVGTLPESQFVLERTLAFKDGLIRRFGEQLKGARAGDTRVLDVKLSAQAAGDLGGKTVKATFDVKDVKQLRLPELTPEFVREHFGLSSAEQLDELIRVSLERNLEHQQRRSARVQVLNQIGAASTWELPRDLLARQARKALNRRVMEMRADGMSDEEIGRQRRLLEQDILQTTALALKEHFVLQKIAEVEKFEVSDEDLDDEIERIADQTGESPRRVRARLEKEDALDALAAEMIERKALDLILDSAEYDDVALDAEETEATSSVETVDVQAVPGEMKDPTAPAEGEAEAKPVEA
jgi:trigger factor